MRIKAYLENRQTIHEHIFIISLSYERQAVFPSILLLAKVIQQLL